MMRGIQSTLTSMFQRLFSNPNMELYQYDLKMVADDIENKAWVSARIRLGFMRDFFAKTPIYEANNIDMLLCYIYLNQEKMEVAHNIFSHSFNNYSENTITLSGTQIDSILIQLDLQIANQISRDTKNNRQSSNSDSKRKLPTHDLSQELLNLGERLMKEENYPAAAQTYSNLLADDCKNPEYRVGRYCAALHCPSKSNLSAVVNHDEIALRWLAKKQNQSGKIVATFKKYLGKKFKYHLNHQNLRLFLEIYIDHITQLTINEKEQALICLANIKKYTDYAQAESMDALNLLTARCKQITLCHNTTTTATQIASDTKSDSTNCMPAASSPEVAKAIVVTNEAALTQPPKNPTVVEACDSQRAMTIKQHSTTKPKSRSGNNSAIAQHKRKKRREQLYKSAQTENEGQHEENVTENKMPDFAYIAAVSEPIAASPSKDTGAKEIPAASAVAVQITDPVIPVTVTTSEPTLQADQKSVTPTTPSSVIDNVPQFNTAIVPHTTTPAVMQQQPTIVTLIQAIEVPTVFPYQVFPIHHPGCMPLVINFPTTGYYQIVPVVPMSHQQPQTQLQPNATHPNRLFNRRKKHTRDRQQYDSAHSPYQKSNSLL